MVGTGRSRQALDHYAFHIACSEEVGSINDRWTQCESRLPWRSEPTLFPRRALPQSHGFAALTFDEVREAVYYGPDVDAAFEFINRFAIVQETAAHLDVHQRDRALDRLRHLLAAHRRADGVWFDSRAWIVAAHRS